MVFLKRTGKSDTKGYMPYASIYMKYLEYANLLRQKAYWRVSGAQVKEGEVQELGSPEYFLLDPNGEL